MADNDPGPEIGICLGVILIIGGIVLALSSQDGGGIHMSVTGYHSAESIGSEGLLLVFVGILATICGGIFTLKKKHRFSKYDKTELVNIAKTDSSQDERRTAVGKINDDESLAEIALTTSDTDVRDSAMKKINDEKILTEVIIKNSFILYESVIKDAIKKINDQNLLIKIARDGHRFAPAYAAAKIKDENILAELAKKGDHDVTYRWFYKHVSDENLLADIAKNSSNKIVLFDIVKKVKTKTLLADIAKSTPAYSPNASKKILKKIKDESLLADIAKNASNYMFRIDAIERIHDENVLIDIVKNDSYKEEVKDTIQSTGKVFFHYPVREKANEKLKGGYEQYCNEEKNL